MTPHDALAEIAFRLERERAEPFRIQAFRRASTAIEGRDEDDLRTALDNQQVRDLAAKFGIPADQVLEVLAKLLPQAVDQHSPQGQLQPPAPAEGH